MVSIRFREWAERVMKWLLTLYYIPPDIVDGKDGKKSRFLTILTYNNLINRITNICSQRPLDTWTLFSVPLYWVGTNSQLGGIILPCEKAGYSAHFC